MFRHCKIHSCIRVPRNVAVLFAAPKFKTNGMDETNSRNCRASNPKKIEIFTREQMPLFLIDM